jgi:hypothetical protein
MAPWNYTGTESVVAMDPAYVGWILVELRETAGDASTATSLTIVAQQAAFVNTLGEVISYDGNSVLTFDVAISDNLFVVVHHRNHLSVLSANPVTETGGVYTYDFSTAAGKAYGGSSGHKEIATGIWGMFAADGNSDGVVNDIDKSSGWENQAGEQGYLNNDYNLDKESNNIDKDEYWLPNINAASQVPL